MPRSNIHGGKHHKKGKKTRTVSEQQTSILTYAGQNQVYAYAIKRLGGSRILVECSDGKERSAIIPGRFFKKVWINPNDVLLCELSIGSNDSTCHIIHKYTLRDANVLKSQGKINFDVADNTEESSYNFESNIIDVQPQRILPDLNNLITTDDNLSDGNLSDDGLSENINDNKSTEINLDDL